MEAVSAVTSHANDVDSLRRVTDAGEAEKKDGEGEAASSISISSSVETMSTMTTTTTQESKSKRRRGKKHAGRLGDKDLGNQKLLSEYHEYEEDGSRDGLGVPVEMDYFGLKLDKLREIIESSKSKAQTKDKKTKKEKKDKKSKMKEKAAAETKTENVGVTELFEEKSKLVEELQAEIENETSNIEARARFEGERMQLRRGQLKKTSSHVAARRDAFTDYALECSKQEEWSYYMSCDGLPDASVLPELNAFLFLWSLDDSAASMETLPRQCEIVTYLIRRMDDIIASARETASNYLENCKQIRQKFRDKLAKWIDMASYCLLREIERNTVRIDLRNAKYVRQLAPLVCCFWALIRLPISMKQISEKDKKAVEVSFEEVELSVKMPIDLDCYCTAIRVLWLGYDYYSDLTDSFAMPHLPEELRPDTDLLEFCQRELNTVNGIQDEQRDERERRREEKRAQIERLLNPSATATKAGAGGKAKKAKKPQTKDKQDDPKEHGIEALPYLPSPEEIVLQREDDIRKETRRLLFTRCKKTEINLRKYTILGGLYQIDLIGQPPQPKDMSRDTFLTTLQLPKELEFVKFWRPYKAPPPAPDAERTPEVIEAEIKALEAAMELLVLVTLKLPSSVIWFEPPLVAHWLPEQRLWSTEDVHDIKYNEEKQIITFRTGRLGVHALAGYRFVNLPFQSWELKPEKGGTGVLLGLTGSIVQLEFLLREDLASLHWVAGGALTALRELMGQFMRLDLLVKKMRAAGCDVFPEADAASYLKGIALKHSVTLGHLQTCMGLLATSYVFSWSRWNATRGPREIVMQIKEVHGCVAKERITAIMLVTPASTSIVNCFEVSPEFTTEPANANDRFYADVYHYALHNAGVKSRLTMKNTSFKLSTVVTSLLEATNVINMSV
ncbi:protein CASC1 [Copidosoma floridanum]|uniref:protein CASC1 n=1 Tax=Copidosoma floridanum TaxID=29053 RepID=UPI0006C9B0E1|nr:protein CASC1 [Copidosoma floridanum]